MDKETLSNYGWIVICVMVLAVMIALATPFGSFVSEAVQSTTKGLFDVNKNALNSTGLINIGDQSFSDGTGGSGGSGGYEVVDGNKNNLHYHNDELFTGTCGTYTYEDGKIVSKIKFDFNGGKGISNSNSQICTAYDYTNATRPTIAYINENPTRDGYTLLGWAASNTATTATYTNTTDIPRTLGDNVTYYAVWSSSGSGGNTETIQSGATFSDGTSLTWEELRLAENGHKYGYDASDFTDISIDMGAFAGCYDLTSIIIPDSVKSIGDEAFFDTNLTDVYYTGTEEQWNAITIGYRNTALTSATIHYNYVP